MLSCVNQRRENKKRILVLTAVMLLLGGVVAR
jgi:hypothetical protein